MVYRKLKGTVKNVTLRKILDESQEISRDLKSKEIPFWNGKNLFVAERKNVKYWNIYHIQGIQTG